MATTVPDDDRPDADARDRGFSLVELALVITIIGVLVAIAVPNFIGSRSSANDRAAQASLRLALSLAKAAYTSDETYAKAQATDLSDPALTFTSTTSAGPTQVAVAVNTGDDAGTWTATVRSGSGTCLWIRDNAAGQGTEYHRTRTASCDVASAPGSGWSTRFSG